MNKSGDYQGFILTCKNGHIEIVKYLWETF